MKHEKLLIRCLLNIEICYIKMHGPRSLRPSAVKDNTKFRFLTGQIFSPKQKDRILPATIEKKKQILYLKDISLMFLCILNFAKISNYSL